jgi:SAM-dependent methyltransferase
VQQLRSDYVLGHGEEELLRLDRQALVMSAPTRALLREAGLAAEMEVLDLGTGTGRVAMAVAELVGPAGRVIGLDRSATALDHARRQTAAAGFANIEFVEADVTEPLPVPVADAAVCRLVLAYQPDPVAVLRTWSGSLRPGGLMIAMEYDLDGSHAVPEVPEVTRALRWVGAAFDAVGQSQRLGPRLPTVFGEAGLRDARSLGAQVYFAPGDPRGPAMLAGVVGSLLPAILGNGIATEDEVAIETLQQRLGEALRRSDAVLCTPTLVACWGTVP